MRRSALAKIVFMLVGIAFLGYAAYLRSILEEENVYIIIGVIIIILGVITFFFGEAEEKIEQEDD